MPLAAKNGALGKKFGRPDIERAGIFIEMPYMDTARRKTKAKRKWALKRPMEITGPKTKAGNQDGYFDKVFMRIFSKEAWTNPYILQARAGGKRLGPYWQPTGPSKHHSTPGDNYGTFFVKLKPFVGPMLRGSRLKGRKALRNFVTSPGKFGGPGYVDITLSKYPVHSPDPYNFKRKYKRIPNISSSPMYSAVHCNPYFDMNPFRPMAGKSGYPYKREKAPRFKIAHGVFYFPTRHEFPDGCFSKYPKHENNPYVPLMDLDLRKSKKLLYGEFFPHSRAMKAWYNFSVLNLKVDIGVHPDNHKTYKPTYTEYLA